MTADAATSRANGAKSRGPKTAAGKAASSRNATKHGLVARVGVLLADESAADYDALGESIRHELVPVGSLEHEIVARVVDALWRLRRCARLEAGAMSLLRGTRLGLEIERKQTGTYEDTIPSYERASRRADLVLAREADRDTTTSAARLADGYISGAERGAWDALTRHQAGLERSLVVLLRTLEAIQSRREERTPVKFGTQQNEPMEPGSRGGAG